MPKKNFFTYDLTKSGKTPYASFYEFIDKKQYGIGTPEDIRLDVDNDLFYLSGGTYEDIKRTSERTNKNYRDNSKKRLAVMDIVWKNIYLQQKYILTKIAEKTGRVDELNKELEQSSNYFKLGDKDHTSKFFDAYKLNNLVNKYRYKGREKVVTDEEIDAFTTESFSEEVATATTTDEELVKIFDFNLKKNDVVDTYVNDKGEKVNVTLREKIRNAQREKDYQVILDETGYTKEEIKGKFNDCFTKQDGRADMEKMVKVRYEIVNEHIKNHPEIALDEKTYTQELTKLDAVIQVCVFGNPQINKKHDKTDMQLLKVMGDGPNSSFIRSAHESTLTRDALVTRLNKAVENFDVEKGDMLDLASTVNSLNKLNGKRSIFTRIGEFFTGKRFANSVSAAMKTLKEKGLDEGKFNTAMTIIKKNETNAKNDVFNDYLLEQCGERFRLAEQYPDLEEKLDAQNKLAHDAELESMKLGDTVKEDVMESTLIDETEFEKAKTTEVVKEK